LFPEDEVISTRNSQGLLALHMSFLAASVGLTAFGDRDFAILVGALSVFLRGPDQLSVDSYIRRKNRTEE
jgi:hypothetical protein